MSAIIIPEPKKIIAPRAAIKQSRWVQDAAVRELIEHLDQEDKYGNWEALTADEVRAIEGEIRKCRNNFVYAAKNYFWIVTKKRGEQLFSLWPSQELIYEKLVELREQGKSQKVIIIKSRQLGCCLDPDTLVLTADHRWIRIDDVQPGQELVSVDEHPAGGKSKTQRKLRRATTLARRDVYEQAYKLTMDNGETLIATGEHRFLCKERGGKFPRWVAVNQPKAKNSRSPIRVGDEIRYITKPWREQSNYEDGWFGGMIDGEGNMRARERQGCEVNVSQTQNDAKDRMIKYLQDRGYRFQIEIDYKKNSGDGIRRKPLTKAIVSGISEIFKVIGVTRPSRFVNSKWWEGKTLPKNGEAWGRVVSVEPVGERRMIDLQTSTKTFIANGFVSHNSTVIEGLIAWRSIFFTNINALVISYDKEHSKYLFEIMATIYDKLPWWLKPRYSSRTFESGLIFDNPNDELRRLDPGTQSRVMVKGANAVTGVGQGYRLSGVHFSEFADVEEQQALDIIEEDIEPALHEGPETFAVLESTAKGANTYAHRLWKRCISLGENANWTPVFLPWFFDEDHKRTILSGHSFEPHMLDLRVRLQLEWVKCDNEQCGQFKERHQLMFDISDSECQKCKSGIFHPYALTDEQMAWMEHKRANTQDDEDSQKKLLQEQSSTAEEAFQVSGYQVFGKLAQEFANLTVQPPLVQGFFDKRGIVHAVDPNPKNNGHCINEGCQDDHRHDFCTLKMWEMPDPKERYYLGADVAEGIGADYSVGAVIRLSAGSGPGITYQVAEWRSNTVGPQDFAEELNFLGRMYNTCQISVEVNRYDTAFTWLRTMCQYPEMYRWKHMDSVNVMSNKMGWYTNQTSRPRLWHNFRRFLEYKMFYVRSSVVSEEMKNFIKDDFDDRMVGHDEGTHDDSLMALMISLWCAYEGEFDETRGYIPLFKEATEDSADFKYNCNACAHVWYGNTIPEEGSGGSVRCERCNSIRVALTRNKKQLGSEIADTDKMLDEAYNYMHETPQSGPEYWSL